MELNRVKRYKDKTSRIFQDIVDIEEWTSSKEGFLEDRKTRLATYKAFQEAAEAVADIAAMMIKDTGEVPKDDYTNLEMLYEKKILSSELKNALKEVNGLRNRLVHDYNGITDEIAYRSIMRLSKSVEEFAKAVEKWLSKKI